MRKSRKLRDIAASRRANRAQRRKWLVRGMIVVGVGVIGGLILFAAPWLPIDAIKERLTAPEGE